MIFLGSESLPSMFGSSIYSFERYTERISDLGEGAGNVDGRLFRKESSPSGLAIHAGRGECHSGAGYHGCAGALHHTTNAAFLHSNNRQRVVRRDGAVVACLSALHAGRRILLCADGVCPGVKHGRPTLHFAVLVIRPSCLLDKCPTQKGGGSAQGSAR